VSTTVTEGYSNSGDYTSRNSEAFTFGSGQTSKTTTVSITNDTTSESTEKFGFIVQRNASDSASTYLAKSTFTITDDDSASTTYSISPGSTTVTESVGTVTFTITRSGATPSETVYVSTTVTEGYSNSGDYTSKTNEGLSFSSGQTSKTVTVSITNDSTHENTEKFGLIVQRNSTDATSTYLVKATFTITDND
jgi:hypothetical protein